MDKNINYDELNRYDFYIKYFLHLAIGTNFEDRVEITENEYNRLSLFINNSEKSMIKIEKSYCVGFYIESKTYVIQEVKQEIYNCLFNSQRIEYNRARNERNRHIDTYFEQENIETLPAIDNTEEKALNYIEDLEIKLVLDKLLSDKQSRRVYKNLIEEKSLTEIAKEEGVDIAAIKHSVDLAIKKLLEKYKKF